MTATSPSVPVKYLDDITECPICTQVLTDPRVLPCIHTFCLKCIEQWAKKTGHKLVCPLCRKETDIVDGGKCGDLPKNFFVEKLLELKKLSSTLSQKELPCDVCLSRGVKIGATDTERNATEKTATAYCVDCRQNMCQQCADYHKAFASIKTHRLVAIGNHQEADELLTNFQETHCDKHSEEKMKIYCFDCKLSLCVLCYITSHNSHQCSDLQQVADQMSTEMKEDVKAVDEKVKECNQVMEELAKREKEFKEVITKVQLQIIEKAEELKRCIENYKLKQLEELTEESKKQQKQTETLRHEVEDRLLMIESFKKYSEELRSKGSVCDVVRAAISLHERANEFREFNVERDLDVECGSVDVRFIAPSSTCDMKNVLGELSIDRHTSKVKEIKEVALKFEDNLAKTSKPTHIIPGKGKSVTGVTTVGDELFVVSGQTPQVDVHDVVTLSIKRQISVTNSTRHFGVAGCDTNKCIYISDYSANMIYRVETSSSPAVANWSVGRQPHGLSVTRDHNVIVACCGDNKLQEYTTQGSLVREISLQSDGVTQPANVVQLSTGNFGVTHYGSHHYCVIDVDGKVITSYSSLLRSANNSGYWPYGLSVCKSGTVFIADWNNSRVMMLNPTASTASQLSVDGGLTNPFCIHIDESRGRLYVGEFSGQKRVIVMGSC